MGFTIQAFVDQIVAEAIRPSQNIQLRMDHMEERINKRLDETSFPDLAKFMVEFKQAQAVIAELKSKQSQQPIFYPVLVMSDDDEGIVDLMGKPLKDKDKKQVDESAERKAARKRKREAMTPEEREKYDMRKASKRSRKDEERKQKKATDEAAGVFTSSAPAKGHGSDPARDVIPPIPEDEIMSTPTTIGVNAATGEDAGSSPHFPDSSDE